MPVMVASADDPYILNEYTSGNGYRDITGRTQQSSIIADRANTKIVIIDGQSEHATANGTTTYTLSSSAVHNLNIYDGGIYSGADPVLGPTNHPTTGVSSMALPFGDRIIARGKATRVIVCPIAVGGTPWAMYDPATAGSLFTRHRAVYRRLRALGLEPDAIIVGRGVQDNFLGTSAASIKASIWAWADGVRALGCTAPIYLGKFTMLGGAVSATVQGAIDSAIDVGRDIRVGYDGDTNLTVAGSYRLGDGVHLTDTGRTKSGNDWADLLYP